jgi:hypothetical protein
MTNEGKYFIKFVDGEGNVLYKENGFDHERNKLVGMNIKLSELR